MEDHRKTYTNAEREEIESLAAAYALGAISEHEPEHAKFNELLSANDPLLNELLETFLEDAVLLAATAPQVDAPAFAKENLLTAVEELGANYSSERLIKYHPEKPPIPVTTYQTLRKKNRTIVTILVVTGLLMCMLIAMNVIKSAKVDRSADLLRDAIKQNDSLRALVGTTVSSPQNTGGSSGQLERVLDLIGDPATRTVTLTPFTGGSIKQRLFFNSKEHLVVVLRDHLGPLDSAHCYQLWSYNAANVPQAIGSFVVSKTDEHSAYLVESGDVQPSTFAISIEPKGGSTSPKGSMLFVSKNEHR